MGLPFFDNVISRKRDQVMAVDLGTRTTKAVSLQRRAQGFALCGFAVLDAPIYEKTLAPDLLTEHLKALTQVLRPTTKYVSLSAGVNDVQVRHADIPRMPLHDMRQILKLNSKAYLQQDLPGHIFDCQISTRTPQSVPADKPKDSGGAQKQKVLVAAARKQFIDDMVQGVKGAGLILDCIFPGLIGPVNAFERGMPELFQKEAVALVDVGFRSSSICVVVEGELVLSRVVGIGGDKITNGLAEVLNISYAEAEGIKIGMASEVQTHLETLFAPIGRELRASLDFFEHQNDRPVTQVLLTGGSACGDFIVEKLRQELMVDCKRFNPTSFLEMQLSPQQTAEIEEVGPQLTVALGAALAVL